MDKTELNTLSPAARKHLFKVEMAQINHKKLEVCPRCHGTKKITEWMESPPPTRGYFAKIIKCTACHGTGKI